MSGQKIHRWTVIDIHHVDGSEVYWNCICDCGVAKHVNGNHIRRGNSKSCGCLQKESYLDRKVKPRTQTKRHQFYNGFPPYKYKGSGCE